MTVPCAMRRERPRSLLPRLSLTLRDAMTVSDGT
jgi:hypothetical protein